MIESTNKIIESLQSKHPVEGLTHNFYRYPARFSPEFAREVILALSLEGDTVLDTFMGGGTTVVEAVANGRIAYGIDINSLSYFITKVKTTPLSSSDEGAISSWLNDLLPVTNAQDVSLSDDPRLRNIPDNAKQFFNSALATIMDLRFPRQRRFARCALMKLGQWATECRKEFPTWDEMKARLLEDTGEMIHGLDSLADAARSHGIRKNQLTNRCFLYLGSAGSIASLSPCKLIPKPKLVLTSPPYPGVHVLYHRWQIRSRRETPAPYWLADLRDGHGESYYTLGGRSMKGQQEYFQKLTQTYYSLRDVIDANAVVVQLVAFSEPESQLPMFLNSMVSAGYEELNLFGSSGSSRPCRQVPNRKWYTQLGQKQSASQEILLAHRLMK
jgi:hypothetical protein